MTFQHYDGSGGRPVRVRSRVTIEAEFLRLMALRRNINRRIETLVAILEPDFAEEAAPIAAMPLSGLVQAAPNVLLFKGGRHGA